MRTLLFLILIFTASLSNAQQEVKQLRKAYKKKSVEQLDQFFQKWKEDIPSISNEEWTKLNDLQQETHTVFQAFYRPDQIDQLGGSEFGKDVYKEAKYLLIQNKIDIYTADKISNPVKERQDYVIQFITENVSPDSTRERLLQKGPDGKLAEEVLDMFAPGNFIASDVRETLVDSIDNFRPEINIKGKKGLYLTSKYDDILNAYLGNKNIPIGKKRLMSPARAKGKSLKRKEFLDRHIKIWQGHWGGYWQLHSYPFVYSITFDKKMEIAKVDFRMIYEGGEAFLEKQNGQWEFITAYRTWIE